MKKLVSRLLDLTDWHQEKREKTFTKAVSYRPIKPVLDSWGKKTPFADQRIGALESLRTEVIGPFGPRAGNSLN